MPGFLAVFQTTYKVTSKSNLGRAACRTCHVGNSTKHNRYGLDVKATLRRAKGKQLTSEILAKVERLDSDGDGATNIKEIEADRLPGDPKSKP